ncbi:MAG TPA: tRNA (adenosine(37)-N6)-dimethylallyltransferase MiaA [Candidatus Avipropionibacterium avicola]|uniref:tRNA dimethylallyltransferase n=1 Tax=Candidatus Avipropionibacterium avicola TaxID=2840701 RepID=A0A9D1GY14_9ACTN|nr:tRNA (adenosine(37)-N6)-dimethylallyltransferase MiaA [Candidatus Avipropionibacterium avicola]
MLIGPTAVGKSSTAIAVAERLIAEQVDCELVNLDSMLVYRGMDIGTAKPTRAERERVRHHLVDIVDIEWEASVAEFQTWAREAIADCRGRGVVPLLVGGSALYTRAVVDEFSFPGTDPVVREGYERRLVEIGAPALHEELRRRDPEAAEQIIASNGRRIVRALEVITLTGKPYRASLPSNRHALTGVIELGLDADRAWLDDRIAQRVDQMWADGLVDEVRGLAERGLARTRTASRALGYRQVLEHLGGAYDQDEARARTISGTRRFARKQYGWYRRDDRIRWLEARDPDLVATIVAAVRQQLVGMGD